MISRFTRSIAKQSNINLARYFSVIKSVPDNKPPLREENVAGRYAGVMFQLASRNEVLDEVNSDMELIYEMINTSANFKGFVLNTSYKRSELKAVISGLEGTVNEHTLQFLDALIENKRISDLPEISKRYIHYYKLLNKEESVTIISARELSSDQKSRLQSVLESTYSGTTFKIIYDIQPQILGGLQIYFGNSFMDCSLLSRVNAIKGELEKLSS